MLGLPNPVEHRSATVLTETVRKQLLLYYWPA